MSPDAVFASAVFVQLGWLAALPLCLLALWGIRRHLRAHRGALLTVAAVALAARLLAGDPDAGDERLPYLTQATCIAHASARADYNLCEVRLFGDVHQLGTAGLFALGFRVWSDRRTASAISLSLSLLAVLILYGVTWSASRRWDVSAGAALLLALHPLALHFAAATQTEALNDCMLLLAAGLVVWDARRGAAEPRSLAARVAASPVSRAFFVAMAANVRPELVVLLPVFAASALAGSRPTRAGRAHAVVLVAVAAVLLVSVVPALRLKGEGLTSADEQLARLWEHLVDVQRWLLGSVWVAVVLTVAVVIGLRQRRHLDAAPRALLLFAVGANVVYAVAPGLYAHVMRHQPHLVYHGSVLLWPLYAYALASGSEALLARWSRRPAWLAPRLLAALALAASLAAFWSGGLERRAGEARQPRALVAALPELSLVVVLHPQLFASAPVAPALFGRCPRCALFEPTGYEGDRGDQEVCPPLRRALVQAQRDGRPALLVEESGLDGWAAAAAERCGSGVSSARAVGGYRLMSLSLP